jgi:hypothetical protein
MEESNNAISHLNIDGTHTADVYIHNYDNDFNVKNEISDNKDDIDFRLPEPVPNYLTPTFASALPPYSHIEVERINNSFRTGSCWAIKKLPHKFAPGNVQTSRRQNTINNLLKTKKDHFLCQLDPILGKNTHHIGTDYDAQKKLIKFQKEEEKMAIDEFCRKPFTIPLGVKQKYEDSYGNPDYSYPVSILGAGTGIPDLGKMVRTDFADSTKFINGPFHLYFGKEKELPRWAAEEFTTKIYDLLVKDWPQLFFKVKFNANNEFVVQFLAGHAPKAGATKGVSALRGCYLDKSTTPLNNLPPNGALNKYMHHLAAHGLAADLMLKKKGDRWGVTEKIRGIKQNKNNNNNNTINNTINNNTKTITSTDNISSIDNNENINNTIEDIPLDITLNSSTQQQTIDVDNDKTLDELWLTFCFLPPWSSDGPLGSNRIAAKNNRINVRAEAVRLKKLNPVIRHTYKKIPSKINIMKGKI